MKLLCRLCAANKHLTRNIFDEDGIRRKIDFRIQSILQIQVSTDDPLPKNICILCLGKLEKCYKFIKDCQSAQNQLQELLQNQIDRISDTNEINVKDSPTFLKQNHNMIILVPKLQLTCVSPDQIMSEICDRQYGNINAGLKEDGHGISQLSVGSAKSFTEPHSCNHTRDGTVENVSNCISFEQDLKSEIKLNDLLTNSSIDIPFDPLDVPAAEDICDKKSSPLTNITNASTYNHGCSVGKFIKNATFAITDPESPALQNNDCLENGCCHCPTSLSKISNCDPIRAQKEYRTVSVTFDLEQLGNIFKNGTIDEAQLQTLGEEILRKNARKIMENNRLELNYKDVLLQNKNECINEARRSPKAIKLRKPNNKPEVVTISDDDDDTNILAKVNDKLTDKNDELMEHKSELKVECINTSDEEKNAQANTDETRVINDPVDVINSPCELRAGDRNASAALEKSKIPIVLLPILSENYTVKNFNFPCHRTKENSDRQSTTTDSEKRSTHCERSEGENYKNSSRQYVATRKRHVKSVTCSACGTRWGTKGELIRHIKREHTDVLPTKCDLCSKTFTRRFELTEHLKEHPTNQQYVCHTCESHFGKKRDLSAHITRNHVEKKIKCPLCRYTTANRYSLNSHNREVHDKRYVCDICAKRFGKKSKLTTHIQSEHTNRSPLKCEYCDKSFAQKFQYRVHMHQEHSKNKRWLCPLCGSDFDKNFQLRLHISRFHGTKTVKCDLCQFATNHKYRLKQHVREVHEKRFTCGTCGKRESKKSRLKVHIKNKHTTKKLYRCRICGLEYVVKYRYDEHMEKHL